METRTFYSDETKYYRTPAEPGAFESVKIRLRTGRYQARSVFLCLEDEEVPMTWESEKHNFDYYTAGIEVKDSVIPYSFRIETEEGEVRYDKAGAVRGERPILPFRIIPGFRTPDWSKGCLYYQIFPDRFCRVGGEQQKPETLYSGKPVIWSDWDDPLHKDTYRQIYGGNLQGIISRISYLKELGIEAFYLNPIFKSPSSHKYDCADYEHIDTGFGVYGDEEASDRLFSELVRTAHEAGIKVVIDGVFNHCSSDHKWFDKEEKNADVRGAYKNPDSPYHDRFVFRNRACTEYEAWWNVPTLPKLNYEGDPSLERDILNVARKWITGPFGADGWRLDVAADLGHSEKYNHEFWKKFRTAVKEAGEDKLILAEHYEDARAWLSGGEWDSIMNYRGFMEPVSFFFTGIDKHSDSAAPVLKGNAEGLRKILNLECALMPDSSVLSALNQLDNHDHSRFLTRTNGKTGRFDPSKTDEAGKEIRKSILRQAAAFMYFWKGSPGLYYGDEAGLCGFTDPDNRRCYPWNNADEELLDYFKGLGKLRKTYSFVKDASTVILYAENSVFAFARFTDREFLITAVSAAPKEVNLKIPVWPAGLPGFEDNREVICVLSGWKDGFKFDTSRFIAHNGLLVTDIGPEGVLVFAGKL